MDLTHDDVQNILKIIDESDFDDVRIEVGDFKLHVQKHGATERESEKTPLETRDNPRTFTPLVAPAVSTVVAEETIPEGLVAVRAPMLGTFYRSPSPGEKPFVEIGGKVMPGDTVCLVEVMKLFNSIKAGAAGTVVKMLVDNRALVEHGQPLILIEPDRTDAPGKKR